ncbi:hypothetical protein V8G61_07605 [Gaetbulibacter sp. M240]|uniref:hypothetical protein n=1 Tax=Gaetbulibacter sp. M240 TaxID=3126511 RepID=UPI00374F21F2
MIKFFIKIRQDLLSKGKTGKYLKYAIGEIILVVIGILIALQLNNLNENIKIENTKQEYYRQLLIDLEKDKIYIENFISYLDSSKTKYNAYLETYLEPHLNISQAIENISKLEMNIRFINFNTNTISSLENTGDIKLIPVEIRNKLSELKRDQNILITVSNNNIDDALDLLKMISVETGGWTIRNRLPNQTIVAEALQLDENKIFKLLESYQSWKITIENISMNQLQLVQNKEEELTILINNEMKN